MGSRMSKKGRQEIIEEKNDTKEVYLEEEYGKALDLLDDGMYHRAIELNLYHQSQFFAKKHELQIYSNTLSEK